MNKISFLDAKGPCRGHITPKFCGRNEAIAFAEGKEDQASKKRTGNGLQWRKEDQEIRLGIDD